MYVTGHQALAAGSADPIAVAAELRDRTARPNCATGRRSWTRCTGSRPYDVELVRDGDRWLIRRMRIDNAWFTGEPKGDLRLRGSGCRRRPTVVERRSTAGGVAVRLCATFG
jgi:hypothetical protein